MYVYEAKFLFLTHIYGMDWLEELEVDLRNAKSPTLSAQSLDGGIVVKKNKKEWKLWLSIVLIILLATSVSVWRHWSQNKDVFQETSYKIFQEDDDVNLVIQSASTTPEANDNKSSVTPTATVPLVPLDQLARDRLTLVAIVQNHNTQLLKSGANTDDLILINEDWTINKVPNRVVLSKNILGFLKQFIVEENNTMSRDY